MRITLRPGKVDSQFIVHALMLLREIPQNFIFHYTVISRGLHMVLIIHCMMASFASVHVSAANKTIVPWSVISLDPSQNFGELFWSVQAGKYAIIKTSTDLTAAVLKTLTYSPSEQHARNTGVLIQCDECNKWRLLFSMRNFLPENVHSFKES